MNSDRRKLVLVIDDDPGTRDMLALTLEAEGYEVLTAADGSIALLVIEQAQPDVILLDMTMPVMDGWEFAWHYPQHSIIRAPLIVITAAQNACRRAEEIGAAGYLAKPFHPSELLEAIHQHAG